MKKFLIIMILFISVVLSACTVRKEIDKTIFTDCTLNQSVTIVNDETADILYKIFKEIKLDQEVDMYEGCLGTISFNFTRISLWLFIYNCNFNINYWDYLFTTRG